MKMPVLPVIKFSRPRVLLAATHLFSDFLFILAFLFAVPVILLLMASRITNGRMARALFSPDEVFPRHDDEDESDPHCEP